MKLLALELSSGQGSIAWRERGEARFEETFPSDRKHSGLFFENLQRCVREFGQADRIVIGLGPGSYAGTRIAIAAAIGLEAASGAELIGLPSFCAMPSDAVEYVAIGDARRESFWLARVQSQRCVEGPTLMSAQELDERLGATESPIFSAESIAAFPQARLMHPSAAILGRIAEEDSVDATRTPLEPIYLREPHITRPKAA